MIQDDKSPPKTVKSPARGAISLSGLFDTLTSKRLSPFFNKEVISKQKALNAPLCVPTFIPLIKISAT